ncbi:MAG: hypothetical protein AAB632_02075 [Patescibacteria group bacterium]
MIDKKILSEKKEEAIRYLAQTLSEFDFQFNHYGIKTTKDGYQKLKKEIRQKGIIYNEIFFNGKHIFNGKMEDTIYEILEPNPGELVNENFIEHVAYVVDDLETISEKIAKQIISRFDVKNTHGIKINPEKGLIIEIRNNDIIDSIKDFSS